jgi:hypothetical protein
MNPRNANHLTNKNIVMNPIADFDSTLIKMLSKHNLIQVKGKHE